MTKYKIWNYEFNWADEFDVYGFEIIETITLNNQLPYIEKMFEMLGSSFEYYFGTNEYWNFKELPFDFKDIDDSDVEVIIKHVGFNKGTGFYSFTSSFLEQMIAGVVDEFELDEYNFECVKEYIDNL